MLQHIKNSGEGFHPPLVPRWGYEFTCTSESLSTQILFIFIFLLQFSTLIFSFLFSLVMIFLASYLNSLQTFFLTLSRLQTIYFVFSDPVNNLFQYFSYPSLQKNNGASLMLTLPLCTSVKNF